MGKRVRIIKRDNVDGSTRYVIQQRHFLLRWWWVDAWVNKGVECIDWFETLEEAKNNLCYFDGSTHKDTIILEK